MKEQINFFDCLKWNSFSKYRNQLMGVAIIFILIFHSDHFINYGKFGVIVNQLNLGVEMFLFLSGMGLYFSFIKKPTYFQFEKKRFMNVYIVYLICSLPFCIWQNIVEKRSFLYFLFDWSSLSYWFKTENSPSWYVSLIIVLYLIYPLLHKIMFEILKKDIHIIVFSAVLSVFFIVVSYYLSNNEEFVWNCIERAFTRIPVFLVGCCCGKYIYENKRFNISSFIFFIFCTISFFLFNNINTRFRYFLSVIPIMIIIILVYSFIEKLNFKIIDKILLFFGGITLELYLTHSFLLEVFQYYNLIKPYYYLIIIIFSIVVSYLLSLLRKRLTNQ